MYVDPNRNRNAGNLRWLMAYCKPDLPRAIGAIVLYAVSAAMALITPLISARIVDQVIEAGHISQLTGLCILMIVVTVVRDAAYYGNAMWMERFGQNTVFRLVSDEYEKLHELDFNYFNHTRTGDIMSRMTSDTDAIRHLLSWVTYQALNCVVMFVGALAMMSSIDWRLALALACVTPPLFLLTRALSQRAKPLFLGIRNSLAAMNSMVEENIEGNRVVKAFVREEHETGKFDERNADYMDRNMAMAENTRRFMPWLDGLGFSLQLITIGLGGLLVLQGNMTLGGLVAFSSYLWMIDSPVRQSGWLVNDWQRFNASCVKIRRLLTSQPRIREESPERATEPRHVRGAIHFDHVSFAFPDDPGTPVLDDIDFTVPAGARLGILGETGAGKSMLLSALDMVCGAPADPTRVATGTTAAWAQAIFRRFACRATARRRRHQHRRQRGVPCAHRAGARPFSRRHLRQNGAALTVGCCVRRTHHRPWAGRPAAVRHRGPAARVPGPVRRRR